MKKAILSLQKIYAMKFIALLILIFIPLASLFESCGEVVGLAASQGASAAGGAAGNAIGSSIGNKKLGDIVIKDFKYETSTVDSINYITINGTLEVIPGTQYHTETFRDLSYEDFYFELNSKSTFLRKIKKPVDKITDGDIKSLEVRKPYHFSVQIEKLPSNIFALVDNIKITWDGNFKASKVETK